MARPLDCNHSLLFTASQGEKGRFKTVPIKASSAWGTGEPRSAPSPAPVRLQGIIGIRFAWFEMT